MESTKASEGHGGYLPFVDGLRAIAILLVVAYHAGLPVPGGFVGVDIFFVISGYLIIGQIRSGLERGTFSMRVFWARRVLRILPAYVLVLVATVAAAPFFLVLPADLADFGRQAAWSAVMMVNHYFLASQGYFDGAADLKPLLHLWSLAVEEQFYLAAPLVMFGLTLLAVRRPVLVRPLIALIFVLSLALCVWLTTAIEDKNYAFFLMPLRAWEFIAGAAAGALAQLLSRAPRPWLEFLGLAAIALLGVSAAFLSEARPYPLWYAVLPVLGTTLLIALGTVNDRLIAARLLAARPMVWIGLVSYAWYLWHWPIIVFLRHYQFDRLPLASGLLAAGVSLLLAVATWALIERPIREWRHRAELDRKLATVLAGFGAMAMSACIGFVIAAPVSDLAARNLPSWVSLRDTEYPADACALGKAQGAEACLQLAAGHPIGLLIGDSHARAIWRTLDAATGDAHLATIMNSGCPALFNAVKFSKAGEKIRANCPIEYDNARALLPALRPTFAVLATRWQSLTGGNSDGQQLGSADAEMPATDQRDFFIETLANTIDELRRAGVQRTIVMAPTPEVSRDPPNCVLRADRYGIPRDRYCSRSTSASEKARAEAMVRLEAATSGAADVRIVDPFQIFCDSKRCRPYDETGVLYRDFNHFNDAGVTKILAQDAEDFAWLFGAPPANGTGQQ